MEAVEAISPQDKPSGLGQRLVAQGLLGERDLERARLAKREMGCMLGEALVRLGLVAENHVATALCDELDTSAAREIRRFIRGFLDEHREDEN